MKIHAYRISPRGVITADQVFHHLLALDLEDRLRTIDGVKMRLENLSFNDGKWALNFAIIKYAGPGRASPTEPIADFEMEPDDGFGEEAAGYYDPASGFMTLQYNHAGPKHSRIQSYLYRFACVVARVPEADEPLADDHVGLTLRPVLTAEGANSLQNMGIVKRMEVTLNVPGMIGQVENQRRSLGGLLDMPLFGTAETVTIHVAARKGKRTSLALAEVRQAVVDFLGAQDGIETLRLRTKIDEDSPTEPIDLLEARLSCDIPVVLQHGMRRYTVDARIAALRQAYDAWHDNGLLQ